MKFSRTLELYKFKLVKWLINPRLSIIRAAWAKVSDGSVYTIPQSRFIQF